MLMCEHFIKVTGTEGDDDLTSLRMSIENIINEFILTYDNNGEIITADITCNLPVVPFTDVFLKMKSSDSYGVKFIIV